MIVGLLKYICKHRVANFITTFYLKVDTIAADKRFHRGTSETNLETRDIGPLKKNGVYIAIQVQLGLMVW